MCIQGKQYFLEKRIYQSAPGATLMLCFNQEWPCAGHTALRSAWNSGRHFDGLSRKSKERLASNLSISSSGSSLQSSQCFPGSYHPATSRGSQDSVLSGQCFIDEGGLWRLDLSARMEKSGSLGLAFPLESPVLMESSLTQLCLILFFPGSPMTVVWLSLTWCGAAYPWSV